MASETTPIPDHSPTTSGISFFTPEKAKTPKRKPKYMTFNIVSDGKILCTWEDKDVPADYFFRK